MQAKIKIADLDKLAGQIAETNQKVGDWIPGHQVIIVRVLSEFYDPHLEVEQRGRKGSLHLSEIDLLGAKFEL